MKGLVSVVIPVYNCEKYLAECLESVINQTYRNIEIILVNSSVDNSGEICNEFATKDSRISVINKKEEGIVLSRLAGIHVTKGEWILNFDGDDKFAPDMIEKMVATADDSSAEVVICNFYRWIPPDKLTVDKYHYSGIYDRGKTRDEVAPNIIPVDTKRPIHPCVWTKLFQAKLLKQNLKYYDTEVNIGEDLLLSYPNLLFANRIVFLEEAFPYYRQSASQATVRYKKGYMNDIVNIYKNLTRLNMDYEEYDFSKQLAKWYINISVDVIKNERNFPKEKRVELVQMLMEHPTTKEVCGKIVAIDFQYSFHRKYVSALKEKNEKKIYKLVFPSKMLYPYRKFKGLLRRIKGVFIKAE